MIRPELGPVPCCLVVQRQRDVLDFRQQGRTSGSVTPYTLRRAKMHQVLVAW